MSSGPHDWVLFLGRFHPVWVHLPIGGLVLLGILELLAKAPRFKDAAQNNGLILGLTAVASIIAALLGWMLSQAGGYDPQLLLWHKWTGFAAAAGCTGTLLLRRLSPRWVSRLALLATLLVMLVASHLGASITHGRGYLTAFAPQPLRDLLGIGDSPAAAPATKSDSSQRPLFSDLIQPILERRCTACHGANRHKGDLSLESYTAMLKGGKDGPVLVSGKPLDSAMIQRLLLPLNDDDHMPPDGKPQPTLAEIAALQWWIERGAPVDKTLSDLKPGPEVARLLNAAKTDSP
jgi:uncharacterized membrane protein